MAHGEDLDRLNGGSKSSVHFVWGRRTQQDRLEQGPANNAIPIQPSYDPPSTSRPLKSAIVTNLVNKGQLDRANK